MQGMHLLRRLRDRIPAADRWELVNIASLAIGSAFFLSLLFIYNWGENPVFLRVFSPKAISWGPGNHHALIMLIFGLTFFGAVALRVAPVFAFLGVYAMVEGYEIEWYGGDMLAKMIFGGPLQWTWFTVVILTFPALFWYSRKFGVPWKYLAFLAPIFIGWVIIGFPITQDFPFHTIYYQNFEVNLLEILTHGLASVGFFYTIYPKLKRESARYSGGFVQGFSPMYRFIRELL